MYRNLYLFDKIMIIDFDEYIIPRQTSTLLGMLHDVTSSATHPAPHFLFRNVYFFSDYPNKPGAKLLTMRKRIHAPPSEYGYSAKSIIDPRSCALVHNHYCWHPTPLYDKDDIIYDVKPEIAALHHYKKCHFKLDECQDMINSGLNDDFMLRYKSTLVPRVENKMAELGLTFPEFKPGIEST